MQSRRTNLILACLVSPMLSCAHEKVAPAPLVEAPRVEAKAPASARARIKYIYVESPATTSATTMAPYEKTEEPTRSLSSEIVHVFWPLLTMMATGLIFILVLFVEHRVLNRQLVERSALKKRLQSA